jgi:multiple sugar transport system substrate-binding protein
MDGSISYSDERVSAVFDHWQQLLDRDCFIENHTAMSWQESQALLYQGKGAMMLMGGFVVPNFPPEIRDKMAYAPFPEVVPGVARAEEAPMNSAHVPAKAHNIPGGKAFLAFMLRADVQEAYNKATGTLPPNLNAKVLPDPLFAKAQALLAGASGIAQYFDRDTSEQLAVIAMRGFQEFMVRPERRDKVITEIERARQRIYVAP